MENPDRKAIILNRVFYAVKVLLIVAAVGATYIKIVANKDYQIVADVSCDPATEKCFSYTCDPADDETCPENPDERTSFYKEISKTAANIQRCEATEEKADCGEELSCLPGEQSCSYRYCDPETILQDEECAPQNP